MRRIRLVVIVLALVGSACSFDELGDFVDDLGGSDALTSHPDVDVQAAGESGEAEDDERSARQNLTDAFAPDKTDQERLDDLEASVEKRPLDPAYLVHQSLMRQFTDPDYGRTDLNADKAAVNYLLDTLYPPPVGLQRQQEILLSAVHRQVEFWTGKGDLTSVQEVRLGRLTDNFCAGRNRFQVEHGDSLDGAAVVIAMQTTAVNCPPG